MKKEDYFLLTQGEVPEDRSNLSYLCNAYLFAYHNARNS